MTFLDMEDKTEWEEVDWELQFIARSIMMD